MSTEAQRLLEGRKWTWRLAGLSPLTAALVVVLMQQKAQVGTRKRLDTVIASALTAEIRSTS